MAEVLQAYARNLLVGTGLGTRTDGDGDPVAGGSDLLRSELARWAEARPGGKTTPGRPAAFREFAQGRTERVGRAPEGSGSISTPSAGRSTSAGPRRRCCSSRCRCSCPPGLQSAVGPAPAA